MVLELEKWKTRKRLVFFTDGLGVAVTLFTCVREMSLSNLRYVIGCPD